MLGYFLIKQIYPIFKLNQFKPNMPLTTRLKQFTNCQWQYFSDLSLNCNFYTFYMLKATPFYKNESDELLSLRGLNQQYDILYQIFKNNNTSLLLNVNQIKKIFWAVPDLKRIVIVSDLISNSKVAYGILEIPLKGKEVLIIPFSYFYVFF